MTIDGKTIEIFKAENAQSPLVILNEFMGSNGWIYRKCKELGCPDFSLAEITGVNWDDELSPWAVPPVSKDDMPFGGKADTYLRQLLEKIIPAIKSELGGEPASVMLAGYSMAGLFALYAATKCDAFRAVASCSGSLWFPGFREHMLSCNFSALPRTIYFSLGDREAHTRNPILRTVEENTREISRCLAENGVNTVFEMNKGNHFQQCALRIAKGIRWILQSSPDGR